MGVRVVAALDQFDRKILALLQENARLTGSELAEKVGLSAAACLRRVQRLRETGVIERDIAIVDPRVFGKRMTVIVLLTLNSDRHDRYQLLRAELEKTPEITQCDHVTGAHDIVLRVQVADMEEYADFVDRVLVRPYIKRYESLAVLGHIK
ncbi:ArsR family transcriptional regulator [Thalassospira marina]|uniref:ArsR family transcriptional regulator n=1 Tax=Thalassospira marina TaxID=2048283 RepID=A0A2N3KYM4_9PROT|nr:ArsR family transcriptional regulator [Thalassospira marina]